MTKKSWIAFILVVTLILGALVIFSRSGTPQIDTSKINANVYQEASPENGQIADHAYAKKDSKVVLIEYGDYQCPSCASLSPILDSIALEYRDKLTVIFRNFPLVGVHPNALAAASAAESAGLQGKFWEMHNLLYEKQNEWSTLSSEKRLDQFVDYAKTLGLDTDRFKTDMKSDSVSKKISYDQALGRKESVNSTPTLFMNGETINGSVWSNKDEFKKEINKVLLQNGIEPPANQN